MELIRHLTLSYRNAEAGRSRLPQEILDLGGMTGSYTRHFYNNLCSLPGARYLEIGSWKGSSIAAALYGNQMECCVAIDNWSEFGGPKEEFNAVFKKYKGANNATAIESDCWDPALIASLTPNRFNIYMYDGYHSEQAQYDALIKYLPCLDNTFIWIVDDWNAPAVRDGTLRALEDSKVTVLWRQETRLTWDNSHTEMTLAKRTWWNGIAIFVIQK
jgi:hypothetical protein